MQRQPRHRWMTEEPDGAADPARSELAGLPQELVPPVIAHRRLRGPYTAAGTILRALVPGALSQAPELVRAHATEILTAAPELNGPVQSRYHLPPSVLPGEQTTRFFSRLRTLRLAHGLAEFIRDYVSETRTGPVSLTLRFADEADQTDAEFIAVLLRRLDPALVTVAVTTSIPSLGSDGVLGLALERHAERVRGCRDGLGGPDLATHATRSQCGHRPATDCLRLAAQFVAADCVSTGRAGQAAYDRLPCALRREMHDARLAELAETGEYSWRLGAIPFHAERGNDPGGRGARALREALSYCVDIGFYQAAVDFGQRARAIIDWSADPDAGYAVTTKLATAFIALNRPDDAAPLYEEVRRKTMDPGVHMGTAYATGILYTRHYEEGRRDHLRARGWLNESVAIASLLPDSERLLLQKVFNKVGLALVENHLGNREVALRLTAEGLAMLPQQDGTDYGLHRSVLHLRRVQILTGLGRLEDAVAEYRMVLAEDPDYPEYHLELGNILRILDRDDEALVEYETVIQISPPFAEAYYNRGDIRYSSGDLDGALADFRYVHELDPGNADAQVNLASILLSLGDAEAAAHVVSAGLLLAPDDVHLLCLQGQIDVAEDRLESAKAALDRAIEIDPGFAEALATRGAVAFEAGQPQEALAYLSRALELCDDLAVLFNRALAHEALANWNEAARDLDRLIEQSPQEEDGWLHRAICRARAGDRAGAGADARQFVALAPGRADEIAGLV